MHISGFVRTATSGKLEMVQDRNIGTVERLLDKNSSADEIANVNIFTTTSYM